MTPLEKRKEYLNKFVDLYEGYEKELADLMCKETGKPRMFAAAEVATVKDFVKHHANLDIPIEHYEDETEIVETHYVPLGVVGAICPWNFPLVLSAGKIAPAVISGEFEASLS